MKIAVVTPVGPNPNKNHLEKCCESVKAQLHPVDHIVVCDGHPCDGFFGEILLPKPANDFGDTPRAIGTAYAFGQGYDAVCWLDADNWYLPEHVQKLVRAHHDTGLPVICSGRFITDVDGYEKAPCVEQVPGGTLEFDTSTYMVCREARSLADAWTAMEPEQHIVGDRIVGALAKKHGIVHCHYEPTIVYRSNIEFHYDVYGWDKTGVDLVTKKFPKP